MIPGALLLTCAGGLRRTAEALRSGSALVWMRGSGEGAVPHHLPRTGIVSGLGMTTGGTWGLIFQSAVRLIAPSPTAGTGRTGRETGITGAMMTAGDIGSVGVAGLGDQLKDQTIWALVDRQAISISVYMVLSLHGAWPHPDIKHRAFQPAL